MQRKQRSFAVLGGDLRQFWLARGLQEAGYPVSTFALTDREGVFPKKTLPEALAEADCVILPLPSFDEDGYLNAPGAGVHLTQLMALLRPGAWVFGGRLGPQAAALENAGLRAVDYLNLEEMAAANAIPGAASKRPCSQTKAAGDQKHFGITLAFFTVKINTM